MKQAYDEPSTRTTPSAKIIPYHISCTEIYYASRDLTKWFVVIREPQIL